MTGFEYMYKHNDKLAWMPPKRLWGVLSEDAWKLLKHKKFIKPDKEILKGIQKGNEALLKGPLKDYKVVNNQGITTALKNLLKGDVGSAILMGPSTIPAKKEIQMFSHPNYGIFPYAIKTKFPMPDAIDLRHEIDEARLHKALGPRNHFLVFRKGRLGTTMLSANHMDAAVIARESNLVRPLSIRKEIIKAREKSGEPAVFRQKIHKRYGTDYISDKDVKSLRFPSGSNKAYIVDRKGNVKIGAAYNRADKNLAKTMREDRRSSLKNRGRWMLAGAVPFGLYRGIRTQRLLRAPAFTGYGTLGGAISGALVGYDLGNVAGDIRALISAHKHPLSNTSLKGYRKSPQSIRRSAIEKRLIGTIAGLSAGFLLKKGPLTAGIGGLIGRHIADEDVDSQIEKYRKNN